jgi:long-chain acyl-CoA synthetase
MTESPDISPDVRTIADLPFHIMGRVPGPRTLGRCRGGQVETWSSQEVFEQIRDLSLGLGALGVGPGDRVALIAESRPEWIVSDLAILAGGGVTVPIYPTLSAANVRYILEDSGASLAIVSTRLQLEKIQEIRHHLPQLQAVVVMDGAAATAASTMSLDAAASRGHARMTGEWGAGREFRDRARAVTPGNLATVIYTSGTTGEPKGVMLSHANLVANLIASAKALPVSGTDVALSFLPLSHAFERMVTYVYLFVGVSVYFAETFDTIRRDLAAVKPTIMTGVPRVYEKLHAAIVEKGEALTGLQGTIFSRGLLVGTARAHALLRGQSAGALTSLQARLADRLVFAKIRDSLGGRLRFLVSGSAPIAADVMEFFHGVGLPIIEGYGLTETAPILTVNPPEAPRIGSVGRALPNVELRIDGDGEILARGPNVMTGYLNKPDATAQVLQDGWFRTGDIGAVDADGYLRITDRKKDLLVTSGGKKIAPQPIEAVLKRSPLVSEVVLLGDRRKYAAALIVPAFKVLERRLTELGRAPGTAGDDRAALVAREDVIALYKEIVDALNKELSQYERIKRFALLPAEFSVESGELTPTLKVKRKIVEQKWAEQIESLYGE